MRTGEDDAGVIGLHRTGMEDEREPGLSVRFRGTDEKGILTCLVSAYYSAAVLVPDAHVSPAPAATAAVRCPDR